MPDPGNTAVDAISISRTGMNIYAYPPFSLIGIVISKILGDNTHEIMIIPDCDKTSHTLPHSSSEEEFNNTSTIQQETVTPNGPKAATSSCASLRNTIRSRNFSEEIDEIIIQ